MSSHHVIRDEQEPPVIILDRTQNIDLLKQLLGWSPFVYTMDETAEWAMSLDIKIDGVLVYKPNEHVKINLQSGNYQVKQISAVNILASLINLLKNKSYTGINIFCSKVQNDKMLEDIENVLFDLPLTLITDFETTIVIRKSKFRKWYPQNQLLAILKGELLENENLVKEGKEYLVKKDGIVQVNSEDSILIIKEY